MPSISGRREEGSGRVGESGRASGHMGVDWAHRQAQARAGAVQVTYKYEEGHKKWFRTLF